MEFIIGVGSVTLFVIVGGWLFIRAGEKQKQKQHSHHVA
jgi:hypothetical protein